MRPQPPAADADSRLPAVPQSQGGAGGRAGAHLRRAPPEEKEGELAEGCRASAGCSEPLTATFRRRARGTALTAAAGGGSV